MENHTSRGGKRRPEAAKARFQRFLEAHHNPEPSGLQKVIVRRAAHLENLRLFAGIGLENDELLETDPDLDPEE